MDGIYEGKKLIGRRKRRRKGSVKINVKEISWDSLEWNDLAESRGKWLAAVNKEMDFQISQLVRKSLTSRFSNNGLRSMDVVEDKHDNPKWPRFSCA